MIAKAPPTAILPAIVFGAVIAVFVMLSGGYFIKVFVGEDFFTQVDEQAAERILEIEADANRVLGEMQAESHSMERQAALAAENLDRCMSELGTAYEAQELEVEAAIRFHHTLAQFQGRTIASELALATVNRAQAPQWMEFNGLSYCVGDSFEHSCFESAHEDSGAYQSFLISPDTTLDPRFETAAQ